VSENIAIKNVFTKIRIVSIIRNFIFIDSEQRGLKKGDAQRTGLAEVGEIEFRPPG
jgi:hypothetical protein